MLEQKRTSLMSCNKSITPSLGRLKLTTIKPFIFYIWCWLTLAIFFSSQSSYALESKLAPPENKVLVFIGQDNESVGGTQKWQSGYVDKVGVPAGITHYVYINKGKSNPFGYDFSGDSVDGLIKETTWGAGPMCFVCYLDSDSLSNTVMHLSISMEFGAESEIAQGLHDDLLVELASTLGKHQHRPFLIRIGYEFDGQWNNYNPKDFKLAWRRIVDTLRTHQLTNFATVFASSTYDLPKEKWLEYWPGDNYVDWLGYSYWTFRPTKGVPVAIELAREKQLPVFIAETTPRGLWLSKTDGNLIWQDWFYALFQHIEMYRDVIKAVSFINANWDSQHMWTGWGDTRIETNQVLKTKWLEKMAEPMYVHTDKNVFNLIGFKPENNDKKKEAL